MPQQFPVKVVTPNTSLGEFQAADYIGIDDGGTGAINAPDARTNLDVPSNADLTAHTTDLNIHFSDAPADAQDYVRNNNAWVVASAGVTDHLLLTNIGVNTHVQIDTHIADATIHFTEASIDHANITNIGVNSHAQIDTHIADGTIHFTEASIDHANITNIGVNSHAQIDSHIADGAIHFTEASIDHANITNIGVNSHAQIDTHIGDASIHFTEASIDHTAILNIGTNSHAAIDTHIADGSIHFADAPADAQDYVRNNNAWVVASPGVTDHTLLTNIGVNTHAQIDTHIADGTIHFTEASIDHANILNIGTNTHAQIDAHIADTDNPHDTFRAIAVTFPTNTNNAAYEILCTVVWPGSTDAGTPSKIAANAYAEGAGDIGDLRVYDVTNALTIAEVIGITATDTANLVDMGAISNVSAGEAVWEVQGRETDGGKGAQFDFNSLTIYL